MVNHVLSVVNGNVYDETLPYLQTQYHTPREFMELLSYNWKVDHSAFTKMKQQQKHEYDLHQQLQTLQVGDLFHHQHHRSKTAKSRRNSFHTHIRSLSHHS